MSWMLLYIQRDLNICCKGHVLLWRQPFVSVSLQFTRWWFSHLDTIWHTVYLHVYWSGCIIFIFFHFLCVWTMLWIFMNMFINGLCTLILAIMYVLYELDIITFFLGAAPCVSCLSYYLFGRATQIQVFIYLYQSLHQEEQ